MGVLIYGDSRISIGFDDRTLAHLQALVNARLRRDQPFFLWWRDARLTGDGQSAVWIARGVPMVFRYRSPQRTVLNDRWVQALLREADKPGGSFVAAEPGSSEEPRPETSVRVN